MQIIKQRDEQKIKSTDIQLLFSLIKHKICLFLCVKKECLKENYPGRASSFLLKTFLSSKTKISQLLEICRHKQKYGWLPESAKI